MPHQKIRIYVCTIFVVFLAYSILRYNLFHGISFEQLPLFILNKVVSWTGLVLMGTAPFFSDREDRKRVGIVGFAMAMLHIPMSALILTPAYFSKLYQMEPGVAIAKFTWQAELSLLLGGLAGLVAVSLFTVTINGNGKQDSIERSLIPGAGRVLLVLTAGHLLFLGYQGWLTPSKWQSYGYLPPITLLAFCMTLAILVARQFRK